MQKQQQKFVFLIMVIAILLGGWLANVVAHVRQTPLALQTGTLISPPRSLPKFVLQDMHGQSVSQTTLAGRWSVLFFGYTSCPDVCPTTLAQLSQVHKALAGLPAASQPQFIFISVDPKRDTAAKLISYLQYFDADFQGFTGTPAQLDTFTKALGVPVIIQSTADGAYTVDHSASLFVINPQQQLAAVISPPYQTSALASDLRLLTH